MPMPNAFAFGTGPWDLSYRFETSWLLPPFVLFIVRALMATYAFVVLFTNIGYECTHAELGGCRQAGDDFSFFTVLTYWGIAFYLLFASLHTFTYARYRAPLLDRWPRPLQALHALLFTSVTTLPFLVTIVYWGLLYPYGRNWFPTVYQGWSNISAHAFNSLFALVEILLSRVDPPPWIHALWLVVVMALYLALAYVTRATKGFYTYDFLDPGKVHSLVAAYVFGIGAATVLIFAVVKGVMWVRRWATEEKLRQRGKFAQPRMRADADDELEVEGRGQEEGGSDNMVETK